MTKIKPKKNIFIVSDATGLTAEMVTKAVLLQFKPVNVEIRRIPSVRNRSRIVEAVQLASKAGGIIVYTLVSQELRSTLLTEGAGHGVQTVDLIGAMHACYGEICRGDSVRNNRLNSENKL